MFNNEWTYETGLEIPEALGSGSDFQNVFETKSLDLALEDYKANGYKNYLIRKKFVKGDCIYNGKIIRQMYEFETELFVDL